MGLLACQYLLSCPFRGEGLVRWLASSPCSSVEGGCEARIGTACRASFVMASLSSLNLPGGIVMAVNLSYILAAMKYSLCY